jgi:formylglycine-generating enzyme required for sulfatase activity
VALTPDPPPRKVATATASGLPEAPAPDASASASASTSAAPAAPPARPASTKGMVLLPGGTFTTKQYRRTATVASFWLDVTEVTAGAYRTCVVEGKCSDEGLACDESYPARAYNYRRPGKEEHPINCVNQAQAMAYCAFVGKRLPNDAEWEWAARGTTRGSTYPWGEEAPDKQLCWKRLDYGTGRGKGTCLVGSFPKDRTPQGILDMAGNVQEWATSIRPGDVMVHGVDWGEANPDYVDVGVSSHVDPPARGPGMGFRCAADGPAASP